MCSLPGREFWPDDVSLRDPGLFDGARLLDSGQVTDRYLLGLAVAHAGRLVNFDRRLVADAVRGGREALLVLEE
jgi:hypothetical protein